MICQGVRSIVGNSADYSRGLENRKNEFDEHLIYCWNGQVEGSLIQGGSGSLARPVETFRTTCT